MKRSDISNYEVCLAVSLYSEDIYNTPFPYMILATKFKCNEKLAFSACERAFKSGFIDYGVSLRTGWLTEKGEQLLTNNIQ